LSRGKKERSPVAVVCSALGTVLLIILVLVCLPLTVPRVFGFHIYTVISGSMEPAISTGSLVYVKGIPPEEVDEEDVIAFYGSMDGASIITHRVVANSEIMSEFVTKGDANDKKDMNPVPYDNYIGKVMLTVPGMGRIAQVFTSNSGKFAAAGLIGLAVILQITAAAIDKRK